MDIITYKNISNKKDTHKGKSNKRIEVENLIEEARNSKSYKTVDDLFDDLNN